MADGFYAFDSSTLTALERAFGIFPKGKDDENDDAAVGYE